MNEIIDFALFAGFAGKLVIRIIPPHSSKGDFKITKAMEIRN
jgi:hypothetical protein